MTILLCVLGYVAFWIVTRPVFFLCYAYFFRHPYSQYDFEWGFPKELLMIPGAGELTGAVGITFTSIAFIFYKFEGIEKKVSESRKYPVKSEVVGYLEKIAKQDPELLRKAIEEVNCLLDRLSYNYI